MSKSTIVSLVTFPLIHPTPGESPDCYIIPAAKVGGMTVMLIGDARVPQYQGEGKSAIELKPSDLVAEEIVTCQRARSLAADGNSFPGIMWLEGAWEAPKIIAEKSPELKELATAQIGWYTRLVELADDDWAQNRQYKRITDMSRHAAKALGLKKDWILTARDPGMLKDCPASRSEINKEAAVCPVCRTVIDAAKLKTLGLVAAG